LGGVNNYARKKARMPEGGEKMLSTGVLAIPNGLVITRVKKERGRNGQKPHKNQRKKVGEKSRTTCQYGQEATEGKKGGRVP